MRVELSDERRDGGQRPSRWDRRITDGDRK
jgi:hypothetical protein